MRKGHLTKREAMKALLAISAVGALAACKAGDDAAQNGAAQNGAGIKSASAFKEPNPAFFTQKELAFLTATAQAIIPKTETPGAADAGVPDVIANLVAEWGDDAYKDYWRTGLADLSAALGAGAEADFTALTDAQRHERLAAYDADIYAGRKESEFYKDMKTTLVTAYYMSETGATEELIYEPVPGDWVGEVPFSDIGKTWAT